MEEELTLLHYGFPLEDAVTLCNSMRREGTLAEFLQHLTSEYDDAYTAIVDAAIN